MPTDRRSVMIGLGASIFALQGCGSLPRDEKLLANFRENRTTFDEILAMARKEAAVIRVAPDFIRLEDDWDPTEDERRARLSDERWAQYKRLFKRADLFAGIDIDNDEGSVYFWASGVGIAVSGATKGYLWSRTAPSPIVKSLDTDLPPMTNGSIWAYRLIEPNWYLTFDAT